MKSLLILGAGGFGRMVAETAQALGYEKVVFLDDAVRMKRSSECAVIMRSGIRSIRWQ